MDRFCRAGACFLEARGESGQEGMCRPHPASADNGSCGSCRRSLSRSWPRRWCFWAASSAAPGSRAGAADRTAPRPAGRVPELHLQRLDPRIPVFGDFPGTAVRPSRPRSGVRPTARTARTRSSCSPPASAPTRSYAAPSPHRGRGLRGGGADLPDLERLARGAERRRRRREVPGHLVRDDVGAGPDCGARRRPVG